MATRQRATAMYFIDVLALRAGNEKGEDEADTVGCCSLRCEHLTLRGPNEDGRNEIVFDFLGKDSIRYYNTVAVDDQVFKNIRIFKKEKEDSDALFDRVNVSSLMFIKLLDSNLLFPLDQFTEQTSDIRDEGIDRQSVPYLQRVLDVPEITR
jgi:DNA topoisomerase IB